MNPIVSPLTVKVRFPSTPDTTSFSASNIASLGIESGGSNQTVRQPATLTRTQKRYSLFFGNRVIIPYAADSTLLPLGGSRSLERPGTQCRGKERRENKKI